MARIVITGSTRGIGFALAREFLRLENQVIVSGRTAEATARAVDTLGGGDRVRGIACDVSRLPEVEALWDGAVAAFGGVDIWINNAGQAHETHRYWEQPPERIAGAVGTNVTGLMYGCQVASRAMVARKSGAIYNMTGFGRTNIFQKGMTIYGTTKRAVDYFSRSLARELAGTGVIVGQINPGMVATDMLAEGYRTSVRNPETIRGYYNLMANLPDEVAPFIAARVLANRKSGILINRQPRYVVLGRLLMAPFRRRRRDVLAGLVR